MQMRKKSLTIDCSPCKFISVNEKQQFVCHWGLDKVPKVMFPAKGKKPLKCKLKRED